MRNHGVGNRSKNLPDTEAERERLLLKFVAELVPLDKTGFLQSHSTVLQMLRKKDVSLHVLVRLAEAVGCELSVTLEPKEEKP